MLRPHSFATLFQFSTCQQLPKLSINNVIFIWWSNEMVLLESILISSVFNHHSERFTRTIPITIQARRSGLRYRENTRLLSQRSVHQRTKSQFACATRLNNRKIPYYALSIYVQAIYRAYYAPLMILIPTNFEFQSQNVCFFCAQYPQLQAKSTHKEDRNICRATKYQYVL